MSDWHPTIYLTLPVTDTRYGSFDSQWYGLFLCSGRTCRYYNSSHD